MEREGKPELDELLQRCLKKDLKAQEQLYTKYGPLMKMVCKRYLFDTALAEEVMNQGFLKVFHKLSTFRSEGNFESWVRSIMVHESLNENRKRKRSYPIDEYTEEHFLKTVPEVEKNSDLEHILLVVNALPLNLRTVFNMISVEGYSIAETSAQLNIKEGACRVRLSRAKELLRKKLKNVKGF